MSTPQSHLATSAWKIIPKFHCTSLSSTVSFYTSILGFILGSVKQNIMCSVAMGAKADANIYIFQVPESDFHPSSIMIALGTTQLDEYYEALKKEGKVEFTEDLWDTEWGYRQFEVRDGDGNKIQFFRFLEGGNPGREGEEDG